MDFTGGIKITVSGLNDAQFALFKFFDVGWGTGDCGNDTIVASIPVPAALPLMLTALGGLGLIMRRRAGDSA